IAERHRFKFDDSAAYAGTYYGQRYIDRTRQLDALMAATSDVGLTIYDRQGRSPDSPYKFPEKYAASVKASLRYPETLEKYRTHLAHLNVNSVTDSPTMFSRRVVEIAASGGVVLSAFARGIDEAFGPIIPIHQNQGQTRALLRGLRASADARTLVAWNQIRAVMRSHTAKGALAVIARDAGLDVRFSVVDPYVLEVETLDLNTVHT